MKLALVTICWRRRALTEYVLRYHASFRFAGDLDVIRVCVTSPDDPDGPPDADGWHMTSAPNEPLSLKWQHGINVARELGADAVMIVASDDLMTMDHVAAAPALMEHYDDVLLRCCWILCPELSEVLWVHPCYTGVGRVIRSDLLDRVDWQIWTDERNHGLDSAVYESLAGHVEKQVAVGNHLHGAEGREAILLAIKAAGEISIRPYQEHRANYPEVNRIVGRDALLWLRRHFPHQAVDLFLWGMDTPQPPPLIYVPATEHEEAE